MPNAVLTRDVGRQSPLYAIVPFDYTHLLDTGVAVKAADLPYGAVVIGGQLIVDVAFNTATTATADVGDLALATRYATAVNLKATGKTDLTLSGYLSDGEAVWIKPALAGAAATAGSGRLIVGYLIKDRASETQPN